VSMDRANEGSEGTNGFVFGWTFHNHREIGEDAFYGAEPADRTPERRAENIWLAGHLDLGPC
jgi:hypothetical protein